MPFYDDLSKYVYRYNTTGVAALNVGWLAAERPFTTGEVPPGFIDRLGRLAAHHAVNRMRGWQACPLCEDEYPIHIVVDGHRVPVGDAEIRVVSSDGRVFDAPTLVVHYVAAHSYAPPKDFIDAVAADERAEIRPSQH